MNSVMLNDTVSTDMYDAEHNFGKYIKLAKGGNIVDVKGSGVVIVSDATWRAITETLHLASEPGMVQSIIDGMQTPVEECVTDVGL